MYNARLTKGDCYLVRTEVIRKRLNKVDEYLRILYTLQAYSLAEFLSEPERYGSAERFLYLSIEALLDIGNHIIADLALGTVNCYSDIPAILAENGYMDAELQELWIQMIGFHNILVHDCIAIDRQIVHATLQHNLKDLEALQQVFAQFL